jgi:hypothetical protein
MLQNSLKSWQSVVDTPISVNQLTNVVPGVLRSYDLPDVEKMTTAKLIRRP